MGCDQPNFKLFSVTSIEIQTLFSKFSAKNNGALNPQPSIGEISFKLG